MNWDDLRYVLAVVEHGSLAAAARQLGVNHATVLRRVGAFEKHIGSTVFLRTAQGYQVRPDKLRLIEAAREVGHAVSSVEQLSQGDEAQLIGQVRITSTDTICQTLLPSIVAEVQSSASELSLTVVATNRHLDMSKMEAEVTVRPGMHLGEDLVGEYSTKVAFAVYEAIDHEPNPHKWIGYAGPMRRSSANSWLTDRTSGIEYSARADSFLVVREIIAAGGGRSMLPCMIAEGDPRLRRIESEGHIRIPLWVGCHYELKDVARLNVLRDALLESLALRKELTDPPALGQ